MDLSDSGSEISDEGYKTSDNNIILNNCKLPLERNNYHSNGSVSLNVSPTKETVAGAGKGHASRRTSLVRTRSMSTDEGEFCAFSTFRNPCNVLKLRNCVKFVKFCEYIIFVST